MTLDQKPLPSATLRRPYRLTLVDSEGRLSVFHVSTGIDAERMWQVIRTASDATSGAMEHAGPNGWRMIGSFQPVTKG